MADDDKIKTLQAMVASLATEDHPLDEDADFTSPAFWAGYDYAVAGVALRWQEALTDPIPKPGVMQPLLEDLYRQTEALRLQVPTNPYLAGLRLALEHADTVCSDSISVAQLQHLIALAEQTPNPNTKE